jgi:hypothetical protein
MRKEKNDKNYTKKEFYKPFFNNKKNIHKETKRNEFFEENIEKYLKKLYELMHPNQVLILILSKLKREQAIYDYFEETKGFFKCIITLPNSNKTEISFNNTKKEAKSKI